MANTYSSLHYHIIFSTKNREPWIFPDIEERIWRFMGGIVRKHRMTALQIGGIEDHIHALITTPPTTAPFQMAQVLKGESSKWIHDEFSRLRQSSWQDGYGVSPSANQTSLKSFPIFRISGNIIGSEPSKRNIWSSCERVASPTMNGIYGADSIVADATGKWTLP
jgi:REP element-mobilizing transposase RayT